MSDTKDSKALSSMFSKAELDLVIAILARHHSEIKIEWPMVSALSSYNTMKTAQNNWFSKTMPKLAAVAARSSMEKGSCKKKGEVPSGGVSKASPCNLAIHVPKHAGSDSSKTINNNKQARGLPRKNMVSVLGRAMTRSRHANDSNAEYEIPDIKEEEREMSAFSVYERNLKTESDI